jgi:dipeptidyl aminopeptidase/acylaminoacyl peptidase
MAAAAVLALAAAQVQADEASAVPASADQAPPKMSVADFVRHPEVDYASISPNGRYLAKLTPDTGNNRLEVLLLDNLELSAAYRMRKGELVTAFHWANDHQITWNTAWRAGPLDRAYSTDEFFLGGADKPKLSILGLHEYFLHRLIDDPGHILVGSYGHVTRESLDSLRETYVADIPYPSSKLLFDRAGTLKVATGLDGADIVTVIRNGEQSGWTEVHRSRRSQGVIIPLSFSADQRHYYTESNVDASTFGIYLNDSSSAESRLLYRDPVVDITRVLTTPGSEDIGGVLYFPGYPEYHFFDDDSPLARTYAELSSAFPKCSVSITSSSDDGGQAVVAVGSDTRPIEYYLLDLATHRLRLLLKSRPWIDQAQMSEMTPFSIKARDGLELHGYLTLPKGIGGHQLPLVVLPHGGPHGVRDLWGFNGEVQFLAYHGYAVLQLNYRGSGGYGRDFERLGYGHWGTSMQDDLTDATRWAIQQGIADPSRICIFGGSYGGYAALMGVIREPDLYRCAIGYAGAYDLTVQRKKSDTASSEVGQAYFDEALGTDPADLKARSPVYNVDRIQVPLLLVHGGRDQRVPIKNFQELTAALDKAGKQYETLVKEDEGHGFYSEQNNADLYTRLLDFLDRNIGARRPAAAKASADDGSPSPHP